MALGGNLRFYLTLARVIDTVYRYQAVPPGAPPALSHRTLPPGQVPTRSFPTRDITPPALPPPGSYTPLRIQESTLLKGELSPNIWTFLKVLQKEQALNEIQITQMMAGQQAPPQRRQYRESGQRILRIVEDFENRTAMEYLRGISHNLSF